MKSTIKTVAIEYKGKAHQADVLVMHSIVKVGRRIVCDDTSAEVQSIDGRKCLDVYIEDNAAYHAMCLLAKSKATAA